MKRRRISKKDLGVRIDKLIALKNGDDGGELYYLEGGHYSHPVEMEELRPDEIRERVARYDGRNAAEVDAADDVRYLSDRASSISLLFYRPGNFIGGGELCALTQLLMERVFIAAICRYERSLQETLIDVLDGCYTNMDSLTIQDSFLFMLENEYNEYDKQIRTDDRKYKMLQFFYAVNIAALTDGYDEAHFCFRANTQRRIIRALLIGVSYDSGGEPEADSAEVADEKALWEKASGAVSRQLMLRAAMEFPRLQSDYLAPEIFTEERRQQYLHIRGACSKYKYQVEDTERLAFPRALFFIDFKRGGKRLLDWARRKGEDEPERFYTEDEVDIDIGYQLYSLRLQSIAEENPFAITRSITDLHNLLNGRMEDELPIMEIDEELIGEAAGFLARVTSDHSLGVYSMGVRDRGVDRMGKRYPDDKPAPEMVRDLKSLDAELLFTAAAVKLQADHGDVNIVWFLRRLKFVFAEESQIILVLADEAGKTAAAYRLPAGDDAETAIEIEKFVKSVYVGNAKECYEAFGESVLTTYPESLAFLTRAKQEEKHR